ncbi:MAG: aldo/keto reductase [Halobacteriaceae archaeon]
MAVPERTFAYRDAHADEFARAYFRRAGDCVISSIGLGTRPGPPTAAVDDEYQTAVATALNAGSNLIDTGLADRHQRSQRAVGRALTGEGIDREAVFLSARIGPIPFDGVRPANPTDHVRQVYIEPGLLDWDDLAHGSHALTPAFIDDQLDRSLANLGVDRLDAVFLETPEVHLDERPRAAVYEALERAFVALERRVAAGDLAGYGVSTWEAFRVDSTHDRFLSLPEVVRRARAAADLTDAAASQLRYIQVPFNMQMSGAFTTTAHEGADGAQSALSFAAAAGLDVFVTAPLAGGELASEEAQPSAVAARVAGETPVQRALNFARSGPGVAAAVVGSRTPAHVTENVAAGSYRPLGADTFDATFS